MPITRPLHFMTAALFFAAAACTLAQTPSALDTFEVATVKVADPTAKSGRFIKMDGAHRFVCQNYTLKLLIAAAYDLNPKTISGGPAWVDDDHYDIAALTPGTVQPNHDQQMTMLRSLLVERFQLDFHREAKVFSIYSLTLAKGGPKMTPSDAPADAPAVIGPATVYPQHVQLKARNASVASLVSLLQRAVLDRPIVDNTKLAGRFDFDLDWAPDETQFGGALPPATEAATNPPLFVAMQEQLGLKLEAMRGPVQALVIDKASRPTAN